MKRRPLIERIADKIAAPPVPPLLADLPGFPFDKTACWVWKAAYSQKVRGAWKAPPRPVISVCGKILYTLRVMLSLLDGVPLDERDGLQACHTCDNPDCVNPYHAYWGTDADNRRDRATRWPESFLSRARRSQMKAERTAS